MMHRPKPVSHIQRVGVLALLAVLATIGFSGCGSSSSSSKAAPASATATSPAQAASAIKAVNFKIGEFVSPTVTQAALTTGGYGNLSLSTYDLDSGATAIALMGAGSLQGSADLSEPPMDVAFTKHVPIRVVWVTSFTPTELIVKPGVTSLRGMSITAPGGSVTEYYLERYLQAHGLNLSDIKFVDLPPADAVSAFKSGAIQGAMTFPPYNGAITASGGKTIYTAQEHNWDVFTQSFINAHPNVVQAFVCDTMKAQSTFIKNPRPAWEAMSKKVGLSVSALQNVMPADSVIAPSKMFGSEALGTANSPPAIAHTIAGVGAFLVAQKQATTAPTMAQAEGLIDRQFAQRALHGACH